MSGAKHTPGPWSVYSFGSTICVCIGREPNGKRPCIVDWPGFDSCDLSLDRQRANARLIAAAPDLLKFAQWVESHGGDNNQMEIFQRARRAIAKATGSPAPPSEGRG